MRIVERKSATTIQPRVCTCATALVALLVFSIDVSGTGDFVKPAFVTPTSAHAAAPVDGSRSRFVVNCASVPDDVKKLRRDCSMVRLIKEPYLLPWNSHSTTMVQRAIAQMNAYQRLFGASERKKRRFTSLPNVVGIVADISGVA